MAEEVEGHDNLETKGIKEEGDTESHLVEANEHRHGENRLVPAEKIINSTKEEDLNSDEYRPIEKRVDSDPQKDAEPNEDINR